MKFKSKVILFLFGWFLSVHACHVNVDGQESLLPVAKKLIFKASLICLFQPKKRLRGKKLNPAQHAFRG